MDMKILLIMDPGLLVPPDGYGGIERLVEYPIQYFYQTQDHIFFASLLHPHV